MGQHTQAQRHRNDRATVATGCIFVGLDRLAAVVHQHCEVTDLGQEAPYPLAQQRLLGAIEQLGGALIGHLDAPIGATQQRGHRQAFHQHTKALFALAQLRVDQLVSVQFTFAQPQVAAHQQGQQHHRGQARPQAEDQTLVAQGGLVLGGAADAEQPGAAEQGQRLLEMETRFQRGCAALVQQNAGRGLLIDDLDPEQRVLRAEDSIHQVIQAERAADHPQQRGHALLRGG